MMQFHIGDHISKIAIGERTPGQGELRMITGEKNR